MHKLRFKPAYNPYTEPSMEIFGYHEGTVYNVLQTAVLYSQIACYWYTLL